MVELGKRSMTRLHPIKLICRLLYKKVGIWLMKNIVFHWWSPQRIQAVIKARGDAGQYDLWIFSFIVAFYSSIWSDKKKRDSKINVMYSWHVCYREWLGMWGISGWDGLKSKEPNIKTLPTNDYSNYQIFRFSPTGQSEPESVHTVFKGKIVLPMKTEH